MGQQGWTAVEEPTGWAPVTEAPKTPPGQKTAPAQVRKPNTHQMLTNLVMDIPGVLGSLAMAPINVGRLISMGPEQGGKAFLEGSIESAKNLGNLDAWYQHPGERLADVAGLLVGGMGAKEGIGRLASGGEGGGVIRSRSPKMEVNRYAPNVSGYVQGAAAGEAALPSGGVMVDRYSPNISGYEAPGAPASSAGRIPYGAPPEATATKPPKKFYPAPAQGPAEGAPAINVDTASLPESWQPFVQKPNSMPVKKSTPNAYSTFLQDDWHSGVEPGTAEARRIAAMHRYDAETAARYSYMLQNENGMMSPRLPLELIRGAIKYGPRVMPRMGGPVSAYTRAALLAQLGDGQ